MNLHHCLTHISHERLQRLAEEFGVAALSPSKRSLLNAVGAKYRNESFLAELLAELPARHRRLLRILVYFSEPDRETLFLPMPEWETESRSGIFFDQLVFLHEKGFLFTDPDGKNDGWILPDELRRLLHKQFREEQKTLSPNGIHTGPLPLRPSGGLEAIFHLLCLLNRRKAPITQKGVIHRKVYESWLERMNPVFREPEYFEFGVDICLHRNLLREQENAYHSAPAANEWFRQEPYEMRKGLWRFLVETKILPNPVFLDLVMVLKDRVEGIHSEKENPIYFLSDVEHCLAGSGQEVDEWEEVSIGEGLRWLEFLGLIVSEGNQGKPFFYFTEIGKEILGEGNRSATVETAPPEWCVLQPNFDLLTPPSVGYETLWSLDQLVEFRRRDVMTQFQITRSSVLHAMRRGWKQIELISFLEEICGGKIPQNVRFSVEEWCGRYGHITVRRVALVECAQPELADEIMHIPEVKQLLDERISDRHFTVAENEMKTLFRILQERGYEPAAVKRSPSSENKSEG